MFHAYAIRFDVTRNLQNKAQLMIHIHSMHIRTDNICDRWPRMYYTSIRHMLRRWDGGVPHTNVDSGEFAFADAPHP